MGHYREQDSGLDGPAAISLCSIDQLSTYSQLYY